MSEVFYRLNKYIERSMYPIDWYRNTAPVIMLPMQAFIAPDDFSVASQEVDIVKLFSEYVVSNYKAKFIYSVPNTVITTNLTTIPSRGNAFRYGYTLNGTDYHFDVAGGTNITWQGTKRYVIVSADGDTYELSEANTAEWIYCGNKVNSIKGGYLSYQYCKFIHFQSLQSLTDFGTGQTFYGSNNLTGRLTIPASMKTFSCWSWDFGFQSNITKITIQEGVEKLLGDDGFNGCDFQGVITFPNSLKEIGNRKFSSSSWGQGNGKGGITSIVFGSGIEKIGDGTFKNCYNLSGQLHIPASMVSVGIGTFLGTNYSSITSDSVNTPIFDNVLYNMSISGKIQANCSIRAYSGTISFMPGITEIQPYCFYNNINKTGSLTIPNTVTTLGESCFYNCTSLSGELVLGNALSTVVGSVSNMFTNTGFNLISGGNSIFNISDNVLYYLGVVGEVGAVYNAKNYTGALTLRSDTTIVWSNCFGNANRTGSLTLPNTLKIVSAFAFASSKFSGTVTLPASVITLGNYYPFADMKNINSIIIQCVNADIYWGNNPCGGCINVTNFELPVNYSSSFFDLRDISNNISASSINQSILNLASGTRTIYLGANKARLLAAYPLAETDANARDITIN